MRAREGDGRREGDGTEGTGWGGGGRMRRKEVVRTGTGIGSVYGRRGLRGGQECVWEGKRG